MKLVSAFVGLAALGGVTLSSGAASAAPIEVPTGYCQFPKEILRPPRSIAERVYKNIQRWTVQPRGGHFAALEQPETLAREIQAFFRPLRH